MNIVKLNLLSYHTFLIKINIAHQFVVCLVYIQYCN